MNYSEIAQIVLKDIAPAEGKPFYVLAAGGPASHKCFVHFLLKERGYKDFLSISDELVAPFFPKAETSFPHHEKAAEYVNDYYNLLDEIVKEAGKRKISIVLEDHGDYPEVYKKHLKTLTPRGYENFLVATTISPENYDAKIRYLMEHDGLPDFRDWGKCYHQRVSKNLDKLREIFDRGMLIETKPSFISDDGVPHAYGVLRFGHERGKQRLEILDEERYKTFQQWKEYEPNPEFQHYFQSADAAMEPRDSAGRHAQGIIRSRIRRKRAPEEEALVDRILAGAVEINNKSKGTGLG